MMKSRAYYILQNNGGRLHWSHLARYLFATGRMEPKLGEKLVDSILLSDDKFEKDGEGYWRIKEKAADSISSYLDRTTFAVVDVETTGGRPPLHRVTEIAAVKVAGGKITDCFQSLINPGRYIPPFVADMTGISNELVASMPTAERVMPAFLDFIGNSVFVAHNAGFDLMFVNHELQNTGVEALRNLVLCTQMLSKRLMIGLKKHSLDTLAAELGIPVIGRHRALGDAIATARILIAFIRKASLMGVEDLQELLQLQHCELGENLLRIRKEWPLYAYLPERPGVFIMKARSGQPICIGSAKNIKERVRGYYYKGHSSKVVGMLGKVKKLDFMLTGSELSAILLRAELTKKFKPKYNLNDGYQRSNTFLKVTVNKFFPRIYPVKEVLPDGALYFGPYKNFNHGKAVAEMLNNGFLLRRCYVSIGRGEDKAPCAYYETNQCRAPCAGRISQGEYGEAVQKALETLKTWGEGLLRHAYERKAKIRGKWDLDLPSTSSLKDDGLSRVTSLGGIGSTPLHLVDIIVVVPGFAQGEVELFLIKDGKLRHRFSAAMSELEEEEFVGTIRACYFTGQKEDCVDVEKRYQELCLVVGWLLQKAESATVLPARGAECPTALASELQEAAGKLWPSS